MIQQIRKIGNSSGIIIPKTMLDKCEMIDNVNMEVVQGMIIIKPIHQQPRENWDSKFKEVNKVNAPDDNFFEGVVNEFDLDEW